MTDPPPRSSPWAALAAVGLTLVAVAVAAAVFAVARHDARALAATADVPEPLAPAYAGRLVDVIRTRLRDVSVGAALGVMALGTAYFFAVCAGLAWLARDATRRGLHSGTWVLAGLLSQLVFGSAGLVLAMTVVLLPHALPLFACGWLGWGIYLVLRAPWSFRRDFSAGRSAGLAAPSAARPRPGR
jgi:hypothetical protein